jgi:hypothetical protein
MNMSDRRRRGNLVAAEYAYSVVRRRPNTQSPYRLGLTPEGLLFIGPAVLSHEND